MVLVLNKNWFLLLIAIDDWFHLSEGKLEIFSTHFCAIKKLSMVIFHRIIFIPENFIIPPVAFLGLIDTSYTIFVRFKQLSVLFIFLIKTEEFTLIRNGI